jgi:type II secretory ATPase GspE/PulE/Tfp pilus assembly ATPase PilB-like protein
MDTPDLHDQPALLTSQDSLAHWLQAMSGGNHWNKPTDRPSLDDWLAQGDDVDPAHHRRARELGVPLARLAGLEPEAAATGLIRPDVARRASDIHLRPGVAGTDVLYRIDDELVPVRRLMRSLHPAVTSRIKVLGAMNLAEHRKPQDGRTTFVLDDGRKVDLGVYKRRAVYEFMVVSPRIQSLIVPGAEADSIHRVAIEEGMVPITQAAVALARQGLISLSEAWRVRAD